MIFLVEGIITIGLSLIAFITLTDRPETARWLTPEEKTLAIARVKSELLGQTTVIDKTNRRRVWLGFWNPVVLATSWVFLFNKCVSPFIQIPYFAVEFRGSNRSQRVHREPQRSSSRMILDAVLCDNFQLTISQHHCSRLSVLHAYHCSNYLSHVLDGPEAAIYGATLRCRGSIRSPSPPSELAPR